MGLHKPPRGARIVVEETETTARPEKIADISKRLGSSIAIVICIVAGILARQEWIWGVVASVVALVSLWEMYLLLYTKFRLSRGWGITGGFLMLASVIAGLSYAVTLSIMTMICLLVLFT